MGLDLGIVQFDGEGTAVEAYAAAKERSDAQWAHEVGFVEHHHNGRLVLRGTFAGHYLDVDESDRVSQTGAAKGAVTGGLIGVLLGPPGIAVGLVAGGLIGSQAGTPTDAEDEPPLVADKLRAAVPRSSSAVVLIAAAADVQKMLAALGEGARDVTRRALSPDEVAQLEASLSTAPPASREQ